MKTIDLHQVDAFTNKIFGGNPAGVVTDANKLSDTEMKQIAREMNLSETAFVLRPTTNEADTRLRYFTPSAEVDFCGHATVGTLYQLSLLGKFGLGVHGQNSVRVETGAGVLEMAVIVKEGEQPSIRFVAPKVDMKEYSLQGEAFAEKFGIPAAALKKGGTILVDEKLNFIYIPITSLEELGKLQFDTAKIRAAFEAEGTVVFCLFANETYEKGSHLHSRVTGPLIGLDEDPFTGAVQSGLVHAAKQLGVIDEAQEVIVTEQGHFMGRPGFATVQHDVIKDEVSVSACAVHVFSAKVEL
jgi:PhzF family phenazine biosynthesis protein